MAESDGNALVEAIESGWPESARLEACDAADAVRADHWDRAYRRVLRLLEACPDSARWVRRCLVLVLAGIRLNEIQAELRAGLASSDYNRPIEELELIVSGSSGSVARRADAALQAQRLHVQQLRREELESRLFTLQRQMIRAPDTTGDSLLGKYRDAWLIAWELEQLCAGDPRFDPSRWYAELRNIGSVRQLPDIPRAMTVIRTAGSHVYALEPLGEIDLVAEYPEWGAVRAAMQQIDQLVQTVQPDLGPVRRAEVELGQAESAFRSAVSAVRTQANDASYSWANRIVLSGSVVGAGLLVQARDLLRNLVRTQFERIPSIHSLQLSAALAEDWNRACTAKVDAAKNALEKRCLDPTTKRSLLHRLNDALDGDGLEPLGALLDDVDAKLRDATVMEEARATLKAVAEAIDLCADADAGAPTDLERVHADLAAALASADSSAVKSLKASADDKLDEYARTLESLMQEWTKTRDAICRDLEASVAMPARLASDGLADSAQALRNRQPLHPGAEARVWRADAGTFLQSLQMRTEEEFDGLLADPWLDDPGSEDARFPSVPGLAAAREASRTAAAGRFDARSWRELSRHTAGSTLADYWQRMNDLEALSVAARKAHAQMVQLNREVGEDARDRVRMGLKEERDANQLDGLQRGVSSQSLQDLEHRLDSVLSRLLADSPLESRAFACEIVGLVREVEDALARPRIDIEPATLSVARLMPGRPIILPIRVANSGSGEALVGFSSSVPWANVDRKSTEPLLGGECETAHVHVATADLPLGFDGEAVIEAAWSHGRTQIPLRLTTLDESAVWMRLQTVAALWGVLLASFNILLGYWYVDFATALAIVVCLVAVAAPRLISPLDGTSRPWWRPTLAALLAAGGLVLAKIGGLEKLANYQPALSLLGWPLLALGAVHSRRRAAIRSFLTGRRWAPLPLVRTGIVWSGFCLVLAALSAAVAPLPAAPQVAVTPNPPDPNPVTPVEAKTCKNLYPDLFEQMNTEGKECEALRKLIERNDPRCTDDINSYQSVFRVHGIACP